MICRWCDLGSSVGRAGRLFAQTARLMVGVPDYDTYAEHRRIFHPGEPVMTRNEFFRERQENRYNGNGRAFRCC
jgi:uncharacterized short protein YbdD (DUF466 family)